MIINLKEQLNIGEAQKNIYGDCKRVATDGSGHPIPVHLGGVATVGALGMAAAAAKGNDTRDDAKGKQQQTGNPCAA